METVTNNGEDESPIVVNETGGSESEVEVFAGQAQHFQGSK